MLRVAKVSKIKEKTWKREITTNEWIQPNPILKAKETQSWERSLRDRELGELHNLYNPT